MKERKIYFWGGVGSGALGIGICDIIFPNMSRFLPTSLGLIILLLAMRKLHKPIKEVKNARTSKRKPLQNKPKPIPKNHKKR